MTAATSPIPHRRTWPQRLLLIAGILVAAGFFIAAQFFWEARAVLAGIPRIEVGAGILAPAGSPGDPVNVLLVGVDSSVGLDADDPVLSGRNIEDEERGVVRPDTLLILRLDPATGNAFVVSLPRDLIVDAPGGTSTRINATMAVGGIESLLETIDSNFSIPINHFVIADFAGFAEIVDIVGGVPVYFPFPTRDLGSGLNVNAGCWSLDGNESLSYVRARSIEELIEAEWVELEARAPDLARIERQQEFMVLALEQVLAVGRSDISRIGGFIEAGTKAVQLDQQLTPGDMSDLAAAFADYDTEALEVATLPVAPQFTEDDRYLGEGLVIEEAGDLLAIFQGRADGIRPAEVTVEVRSDNDQHVEQLAERGFVAESAPPAVDSDAVNSATTVVFDPADRDATLLLARYLEGVPRLEPQVGASLQLLVGLDFSGVRVFPRPVGDIAPGLDAAIRVATASAPPSTVAPNVGPDEIDPDDPERASDPDDPSLSSTSSTTVADVSIGPGTVDPQPSTLVQRGRPPDGVLCQPTGG